MNRSNLTVSNVEETELSNDSDNVFILFFLGGSKLKTS